MTTAARTKSEARRMRTPPAKGRPFYHAARWSSGAGRAGREPATRGTSRLRRLAEERRRVYDPTMATKKPVPEGPVEVPDVISILPLRNSVLFPGSIIPIDVGRKKSVKLVEEAISKERPVIGIVTQRDARTEEPGPTDLYMVGCAARILKVIKLAKDNFSVILQGVSRIRILEIGGQDPFMTARVQALPDSPSSDVELDALVLNVKDVAKRVIKLMPELPKEASALVDSVVEPGQLSDVIISNLDVQVDEKQDVLETFDLKTRLRKVLQFLSRQHEVLKVREKINSQVQEEMGRNQREYVLRQQLKA